MIASMMLVAVAALAFPTLAAQLHTPAASHERALGAACAVLLLIVYVASLRFTLSADPERTERHAPQAAAAGEHWPLWIAITVLVIASVGAAAVSEWFVSALEPAIHALHISQAFAGIVIVAGSLWIAAFVIYLWVYIPILVRARVDGTPG